MGKFVRRALLAVPALVAFLYVGDYAAIRLRVAYPRLGSAYDSVQVVRLFAIPLKNGATEYELDALHPQQTVHCVRSVFPHLGCRPCWYLRRNSQKPIPMLIFFDVVSPALATASGPSMSYQARKWGRTFNNGTHSEIMAKR